ncbi:GDP-mannose 4,6-dehydratase [Patescibacteria group bacterium]|nr:GDP-mannose 4,6-dehydratase [Patescibacteria group bacterium]MBU1931929.1 GDP-mannose 4,6-dehydratase [Patescibacteria group bacterium]
MAVTKKYSQLAHQNILVTGGYGLVGSHLTEKLVNLKAKVIVPKRSHDPQSYFNFKKLGQKVVLVDGDIKDFKRVWDIVTKYEIDYIFHLAAQAIVDTAYYNPLETLETNIMGTANVLEAARLYGKIKAIVVASSDKAYGKLNKVYEETDPLRGDHPYEVSKSAADLISQTYFKTYGLPVAVSRFGNIYGPGDLNFSRIIPDIIKSIITKKTLTVRSNGKFVRDYVYVKDVVIGYLDLATQIEKCQGEAFNFSSDDMLSVVELIRQAEKILNSKVKYKIMNTAKNEIPFQSLSYKKARRILGWRPQYNLKTALPPTFRWYTLY